VVSESAGLCGRLLGCVVTPAKIPIAGKERNRVAQIFQLLAVTEREPRKSAVENSDV